MTVPPDPAPIAVPRDAAAQRPPRLLGPAFWAMIAFSVLCVAAGAGVVAFGPRQLADRAAQPAAPAVSPRAVASPPAAVLPVAAVPSATATAEPAAVDVSGLSERLAVLEQAQAQTAQAAAAALAASALVEAAQGSGPFAQELAGLAAAAPSSIEIASLKPLAEVGAPSRAALAASFPGYAARAASASRAPGNGAGLFAQARYALGRVVTLRRVGDVPGTGVDAALARAERLADDGDVAQALRTLDALPPAARDAVGPWRASAERRVEIDRRVAAIRAQALDALSRVARSAG